MNQHPRAKEMGITAGPAQTIEGNSYYLVEAIKPDEIHGIFAICLNKNRADAVLILDAVNTCNATGRTPSELVEERDRYRDSLKEIAEYGKNNQGCCPYGCDCPNIAQEALTKTENI